MKTNLKNRVIKQFSSKGAQSKYTKEAKNGFWLSEEHFINKYFIKKGKVLDIGCGTGRATIPFSKLNYDIIGIDLVPVMIKIAKEITKGIDYRIGDVTKLDFPNNTFDYALFSNVGWTSIPGGKERQKALQEIYTVLKNGGIFIFNIFPRKYFGELMVFWAKKWIKFFILKPLGFTIFEEDFGDIFFRRKTGKNQYETNLYLHVPSIRGVKKDISKAGFKILEINGKMQKSDKIKKHLPVFFICKKSI